METNGGGDSDKKMKQESLQPNASPPDSVALDCGEVGQGRSREEKEAGRSKRSIGKDKRNL